MHLMRVFRAVCLESMHKNQDSTFEKSALVNPALPNAFSALERVYVNNISICMHSTLNIWCRYLIAKRLVKSYGNVRIFNAEACHRPKGYENDPRFADNCLIRFGWNLKIYANPMTGQRSTLTRVKARRFVHLQN